MTFCPSLVDCVEAYESWGFNCGPAALCAILRQPPAKIRLLMPEFERRRYTNPTAMFAALDRALAVVNVVYRGDVPCAFPAVEYGVVRVQWGGRWTNPGVPMAARYGRTHWVAMASTEEAGLKVFDVNAVNIGGWMPFESWRDQLMPWLAEQAVPGWDGRIWPTHVIEVKSWGKA